MDSLRKTSKFEYCNNDKESFRRGPKLSTAGFQKCADRGELLVHITPTDLILGRSKLRTPEAVFEAAHKAGFRTLITNFRQNQLARDVSHYRQDIRSGRVPKLLSRVDDLIGHFEEMKRFYIRGVEAAREFGLTIVPCNFESLTEDVCPCVQAALSTLSSLSSNHSSCLKKAKHSEDAKNEKALESLVPPELAEWMQREVLGTEYEWMLDMSANDWPKEIAPPVPMPKWLTDITPVVHMSKWRPNPCPGLLARRFSLHPGSLAAWGLQKLGRWTAGGVTATNCRLARTHLTHQCLK
eukprot:Skav232068  [mRNA]  locus=scaffold1176:99932:100819:- [translate_table: standard]